MQKFDHFVGRFGGVSSVAFLTYLGEYMSFIVVLAFLSDKLTVTFGLGLYGFGLIGTISGAYLVVSGLIAIPSAICATCTAEGYSRSWVPSWVQSLSFHSSGWMPYQGSWGS